MSDDAGRILRIVKYLSARIGGKIPEFGIICGSGLGGLAKTLQNAVTIYYEDIDEFPQSTVEGHAGELVFGDIGDKFVVCMRGRFHFYEGYAASEVTMGVKVMAGLGIKAMFVTNAAGGVNPAFQVGDLMIMKDHVCFGGMAGFHPLVGRNDKRMGPRFPPVGMTYRKQFQDDIRALAKKINFTPRLVDGTYVGLSGPNYETPAEIQMFRILKVDAVGMSTVFEVIQAAHAGIPCIGMSLITNRCKGPDDDYPEPNHAEVLEAILPIQEEVQRLVREFVKEIDLSKFPRANIYKGIQDGEFEKESKLSKPSKGSSSLPGLLPCLFGVAGLAVGFLWASKRK